MTKSQLLEKVLLYGGNRVKDLVQVVLFSPSQLERAASHFSLSWRERKQNFNSEFLFPPSLSPAFPHSSFGSRTPRRSIISIALPFAHPIFFYTLRKVNASFDCRVDSEMSPPPIRLLSDNCLVVSALPEKHPGGFKVAISPPLTNEQHHPLRQSATFVSQSAEH
jgi:hypothetical protein